MKIASGLSIVIAFICAMLLAGTTSAQRPEQGPKPVAKSQHAMASTSHPAVTKVILDVLRDGGNAVDALLTAIPLQHVIEPQMSTLAGGMGGLIYWAKTGELIYLDAELDHTLNAPASYSMARPADIGTTSGKRIGVPGTVPGMAAAASRFGSRPWSAYFDPAIRMATDGFTMYSFLYGEMSGAYERLGAHPSSREKWLSSGFVPPVGDLIRQPVLARTLGRLASQGPDYFTSGDWAQRFVAETNRTGGSITVDELSAYEPRWVEPLSFEYRGHKLRGAPPASNGGILNGMILNILESFDLETMGHYTESADSLYVIRRAYEQAQNFSTSFVADPRNVDVPSKLLLSKELGRQLASIIDTSKPVMDHSAAASAAGAPLIREANFVDKYSTLMHTDTNHLVIVDEQGNWVSMTHTVYGDTFGTGLTVDGVGVNSGNTFPGTGRGKGRRVITPFPALMAVNDEGVPWLALGSPGLASSAVALTLINMLGYGMDAYAAVDAPRFQGYGRYDSLHLESRVSAEVIAEMQARGVTINLSAPYNWHLGSIQLIERDQDGLTGVADPRRGGFADGY
ncbi:gamma-glutamyltransferase family protein [Congregibacter sp.]|uniref:gamma-glutamyltransferase family protein n=1 Tax=Congregibacter sp. TaxID=2744308 RepID=UPI0039E5A37E